MTKDALMGLMFKGCLELCAIAIVTIGAIGAAIIGSFVG